MHQNWEVDVIKSREKAIANTVNYEEKPKWGKNHEKGERSFTILMAITIGFSRFR